jgi:MFS family permease
MNTNQRRNLARLYLAAVFFFWASMYVYMPTLPQYVQGKTNQLALVGIVLSMYGLWQALLRLPLGVASDRVGRRKPFIIICFIFSALGAWLMSTSSDALWLGIGRGITGLAAAGWVPLVVAFSGLFPPKDAIKAATILSFTNFISRMLITNLTGFLNEIGGYSLAFYVAIGLSALAVLAISFAKEERIPSKITSIQDIGRIIIRKDVILPSMLGAVNQYAVFATTFAFMPILAKQLGATDVTQSILMSFFGIGAMMLGSLMISKLMKQFETRNLIYVSFILTASGIGILALASTLWMVFVAQFLIGFASGIGYPTLMGLSIERVSESERATAMGVFQSVYAFGMFAGPYLNGWLADAMGLPYMFVANAIVVFLLGMLGTIFLNRSKEQLIRSS